MYSQSFNLNRRVIHHNNLIELATFFEGLSEAENGVCTFYVTFRDGSFAEMHHAAFFNEPYFKYKDASRIQLNYVSPDSQNRISLCLVESIIFSSQDNQLEISSNNEQWLHSTVAALNDLIAGIPKLSFFRILYTFPWVFVLHFIFQVICWFAMRFLGFEYGDKPLLANGQANPDALFIPASAYFLMVILLFFMLTGIICTLYPEQEFAFGTFRHPRRLLLRKVLGLIITTTMIPILLSFLL